jgi:hypothetical protein
MPLYFQLLLKVALYIITPLRPKLIIARNNKNQSTTTGSNVLRERCNDDRAHCVYFDDNQQLLYPHKQRGNNMTVTLDDYYDK